MTETRKAIIELIEPFMDKTLSEGCLVELKYGELYEIGKNRLNCTKTEEFCFEKIELLKTIVFLLIYSTTKNDNERLLQTRINIEKILGHYDITTILKYIKSKGYYINSVTDGDLDIFKNNHCYGNIPNKPFHLYTEQEDKELLELLLKLK